MKKLYTILAVIMAAAFLLTACGPAATPVPVPTELPATQAPPTQVRPTATNTAVPDLLSTIKARGTLVISTDPAYPPQSEIKANPQRTPGTKCTSDQKTLGELEGFDIDVAAAIAKGLGVEPCWVTPDWTLIVAGNWAGRWDISVGSMSIYQERAKVLYFAQPYYTTPAAAFVYKTNTTYKTPADLSGKKVGVCGGCTYESFLNESLVLPGENINFIVKNATIKAYDTDSTALADLELGDGVRLDAVITAQPTGQAEIKNGKPIKQLGDPVFSENLAPAFDRSSSLDPHSLVATVSQIIQGLHKDGTLSKLCIQWEGSDLTGPAAAFDASQFGK